MQSRFRDILSETPMGDVNNRMEVNYTDCDFSPMKNQLKDDLTKMVDQIQKGIAELDNEERCLLGELEQIKNRFLHIESKAATFYLNCYLAPFTDKYLKLSISIRNLSERRHGALIVVQRKDPLDSLIKTGIPIEASVSQALLESIFYPGNPLHDGAVLIKSNRIVSAANILPLSTHFITHQQKLGTRHRAALGLTEQSDAIVLIVSEETGKTSFAVQGQLYPMILH